MRLLLLLVLCLWLWPSQDSQAANKDLVKSVLLHQSNGPQVFFQVPEGTRSVSLQGWAPKSKKWVRISSRRAPLPGANSLRVPRLWQQRSVRVVASSRVGEAVRMPVDHQVSDDGRSVIFTASQVGARLYSIETRADGASGWQRVSTVAAPAEGSPALRVALPSSLPPGADLRVVAVAGAPQNSGLLTPLSERLTTGPVSFGGNSAFGGFVSLLNDLSVGNLAPGQGRVEADQQNGSVTVSQSDVWSVRGSRIYFFNQLVGLQIINAADRHNPVVAGQLNLPAVGEQMYLLGGDGNAADGALLIVRAPARPDQPESTRLLRLGVTDDRPLRQSELDVPGYFVESRMAGNMLHLVTSAWADDGGEWRPRTWLTSFDLSTPGSIVQTAQSLFDFSAAQVGATAKYLWVCGPDGHDWSRHRVYAFPFLLDGSLGTSRSAVLGGVLLDKFKVGDIDGGLAAVVQSWRAPDGTWQQVTAVETFADDDSAALAPLARLELIRDESLFATRFDASRLYAVTFRLVDPLWLVDLSNPAAPSVVSELEVPGWSSFIEPMGDVLIAVGREDGRVQVSLFDVSNPAEPSLAQRIYLGSEYSWSEAEWDERAVRIVRDEGLILLPVTEHSGQTSANKVALIDFDAEQRTLQARGSIAHDFSPRRATLLDETAIASISNRELLVVDASDRDNPLLTAEIRLAFGCDHLAAKDGVVYQLENGRHGAAGDSGRAVLRIAPASAPADVSREIFLQGSGVAAAAVFGDRLCVVETNQPEFFALALSGNGGEPDSHGMSLSVFSLVDPSAPILLGRIALQNKGRGTVTLHQLAGGNIAVAQRSSGWLWRPYPIVSLQRDAPAASLTVGDARIGLPWDGWNRGSLFIDIVGIPGDLPLAIGSWRLEGGDISDVSDVHSAGDLLAFSFVRSVPNDHALPEAVVGVGVSEMVAPKDWSAPIQRHLFQILDLADPSLPMPWAPVEVPGQLVGVSWLQRSGGVLFTKSGEAQDRVAALGFDGESASLASEVEVGSGPVSTSGPLLFAGYEGGVREWTFDDTRGAWQTGRGWSFRTGYGLDALQPMDGALLASGGGDIWALLEDGSIVPAQTAGPGNVQLAAQSGDRLLIPAGEFGTLSLPLPQATLVPSLP